MAGHGVRGAVGLKSRVVDVDRERRSTSADATDNTRPLQLTGCVRVGGDGHDRSVPGRETDGRTEPTVLIETVAVAQVRGQ